MENKGRLYTLWKAFGWYDAAPNNFTRNERRGGDKITFDGDSTSRYYYSSTSLSPSWINRQTELSEMIQYEAIKPIIDLYAEECCQPDINKRKTLWYTCNDAKVEEDLNNMLERIDVEDHIYSIAFSIAGLGNCFRRVMRNETGVVQIIPVESREITRIWSPSTRRLIGYKWQGESPYTPDPSIAYMEDSALFAPWDFIHFRRISDNAGEYGTGLIEHLFGTYRKIKMALDAMVVYRLHTMPNRHMMWLDMGNQTVFEISQQVNQLRNLLRNQVSIDTVNGSMETRYNPPATDSILFFPKRKEEDHKLEAMAGTNDIPDVHDLDLLYKQLYGGSRVPKEYLGFGENGGLANASLVTKDIRFARMIRVLRMPIIVGFKKLAELHLAFQGYDPSNYNIQVNMSKVSSIEEEVNAAAMSQQVALASNLASLCQSLAIPNKEIIDLIFKEYLHVPLKFVEIAKLAAAIEKAVQDNRQDQDAMGGGMGGGPIGGTGLGGGIGDLESELGLGVSAEKEPATSTPTPTPTTPLESEGNRRISNLFENKDIQYFFQSLKKGRGKTLNESKEEKHAIYEVRRNLITLSEIVGCGKTSLVEGSVKTPLTERIEFLPKKPINRELHLDESYIKSLKEGLKEYNEKTPSINIPEVGGEHPVVKMVRNSRR